MPVLSQCVVAFDERRASPASNVGTLGSAGDVTWTGSVALDPSIAPHIYLPGVAGNAVSCTAPATATQFRATPVVGAPTTGVATGSATFTFSTAGTWTSIALLDASDIVVAELVTPALETATSFVDAYAVTWAIDYSTGTGLKTAIVRTKSRMLNGTTGYGLTSVPVSLGASADFTLFIMFQTWVTGAGYYSLIGNRANAALPNGYEISWSNGNARATIGTATAASEPSAVALTRGAINAVALVRDSSGIRMWVNGSMGANVTPTGFYGNATNASSLFQIGARYGAASSPAPIRFYAGLQCGVAMTATQLATLKTQLTGADTSVGPRVATLSVPTREVALSVDSREVALSVPTRTLELTV